MNTYDISRRRFLQVAGATMVGAALAGCESGEQAVQPPPAADVLTPSPTFTAPTRKLSGDLKILLWSHFVPAHDQWFDPFVQEWGKQVGVNVTVDHINQAEIPARTAAEIQAKQGHDLIQYIATFSQFEPKRCRPERRCAGGREAARQDARRRSQIELQSEHQQVLRVRAGLGSRSR